jgi:hypothetical protein
MIYDGETRTARHGSVEAGNGLRVSARRSGLNAATKSGTGSLDGSPFVFAVCGVVNTAQVHQLLERKFRSVPQLREDREGRVGSNLDSHLPSVYPALQQAVGK